MLNLNTHLLLLLLIEFEILLMYRLNCSLYILLAQDWVFGFIVMYTYQFVYPVILYNKLHRWDSNFWGSIEHWCCYCCYSWTAHRHTMLHSSQKVMKESVAWDSITWYVAYFKANPLLGSFLLLDFPIYWAKSFEQKVCINCTNLFWCELKYTLAS